jgi:hypothetical protein
MKRRAEESAGDLVREGVREKLSLQLLAVN